ncbi:MAG: flagellar motor protein [Acidobacteria bacterium]|nr:flagellar motor protein [Acidobacteriota bacterium]
MNRKRRFDLTSVIGVPIGLGFILVGQILEGGTVASILQVTAAVIVFGGTLGAVLLGFSTTDVRQAWRALPDVFLDREPPTQETIAQITRFAVKARKDGIMSLEDDVDRLSDSFLRRGLSLAVDGTSPNTLRSMLENESASRDDLEEVPAKVYESAGGYAPTIGILGAVLGLIHVMENLSDPTKLGAGIAVAFVATVYGVGSANLIFLPIATKLRAKARRSAKRRELVVEGILAIQEGMNPRLIDQKLHGLLGVDVPAKGTRAESKAA